MSELQQNQLELKEAVKSLRTANSFLISRGVLRPCQRQCLTFDSGIVSQQETECMSECIDKLMFIANATHEFDSAEEMGLAQGKPKKSVIYQSKRIEDLT